MLMLMLMAFVCAGGQVLLAWVLSNGILLVAILGGGDPTTTFSTNNTLTRTKAYMTFILAFVGITSIVVRSCLCRCRSSLLGC